MRAYVRERGDGGPRQQLESVAIHGGDRHREATAGAGGGAAQQRDRRTNMGTNVSQELMIPSELNTINVSQTRHT